MRAHVARALRRIAGRLDPIVITLPRLVIDGIEIDMREDIAESLDRKGSHKLAAEFRRKHGLRCPEDQN